jgi:uncharacterized membrane protein
VTVPIGAWIGALVFDVASHIVSKPGFLTQGAEWLIALGVLGALAAAMVGFLDLFAIPTGTAAFRTGLLHMTLNLIVTGAYTGNFFWRHATYTDGRPVPGGPLTLSAISIALLAVSGFLGGKLAYRYGVRVADEGTQAAGFRTRTPSHSAAGADASSARPAPGPH